MIVAAPSVPHTGKHFLEKRVFKSYVACSPLYNRFKKGDYFITAHFDVEYMDAWSELVKEVPVVVPLRHPARVLASYRKRATIGSTHASYIRQWESLVAVVKNAKDILYLHVDDRAIRDAQAAIIFEKFNLPHDLDWSVAPETGSKHNTHDIAITDELLKDVPVELINFYESKKVIKHGH